MQRMLAIALLITLPAASVAIAPASAQSGKRNATQTAPPAGGDALYSWCRREVFRKYGSPIPVGMTANVPKGPKYLYLEQELEFRYIQSCIQGGGKGF